MLDKLMDAVIQSVDAAVEERAMIFGPHYASALEGYGDVARELLGIQESAKALKKSVAEVVGWVSAQDPAELIKALNNLDVKAKLMAYEALKMCAAVERFRRTIKDNTGGDLFVLLEDPDSDV